MRTLMKTAVIALLAFAIALPLEARRHRQRRPKRLKIPPLTVCVEQRTDLLSRPGKGGEFVGTVARGTRLPIIRMTRGGRCKKGLWYEVTRGAWMCAAHGRHCWRLPSGVPQPVLRPGRLVPRIAFYARRDGVPIFTSKENAAAGKQDRIVEKGFSFSFAGTVRIAGKRYIRTRRGEIVPRPDMHAYNPSSFAGRALSGKPTLPIGCSIGYKFVAVRDGPSHRARRVDKLAHHAWVQIHEQQGSGRNRFYRIEKDRWVKAQAIRRVHFSAPPPGVGPDERWVEILLQHQTLVAYEGQRPVFATLVSTGRPLHKTPRGLFRVRTKVAMATMNNRKGAGDLYRVDDVPWIMYFHEGYALHGTYWHNGFGRTMSHGCVNLAPKDARWLFGWAPPRLVPGWSALLTTNAQKGLLVRARNTHRETVQYRGPPDQRPGPVTSTQ